MIASGACRDDVAAAKRVLPDEVRPDVGVALFRQIAVRGAANEPTVSRRIEPAKGLAVRDDWRGWLMRLLRMLALTTAAAIATIASAVAVELLILGASARSILVAVAALVAIVAIVAVMAVFAMFSGPLFVLAELSRWALLLLACLSRRFGRGRRRRQSGGCVLRGYEGHGRRRGVVVIVVVIVASINWSFGGSVSVRVRLASLISGRTAV
jgi:hypothetical protein